MGENNYQPLEEKALWVRRKVLEMAVKAGGGHISSAFSQTELLVALFHGKILNFDPKNEHWTDRDRFILSKGQGGIGFYPVLADAGYFPLAELDNFLGKGSMLGVHSDAHIPGIEVTTGSLGHGLPMATGKAYALKNHPKKPLVVCMLGDAELYEGSNWEACFYAAHAEMNNLICIVDRNGQGVLGKTDDIATTRDGPRLEPLHDKFSSFGFEVRRIDGHSFAEIFTAFSDIRTRSSTKPLMIIADTFKGKGVELMEDQRMWHYRVPTGFDLERCHTDLGVKANG